MEFCVFFVIPFGEDVPRGDGDEVIERVRATKEAAEEECMAAYTALRPEKVKLDHQVWAQSRIDFETRVIGVSLRLPIEKGAEHHVLDSVVQDDFLYWDYEELIGDMQAMKEAADKVAAAHGVQAYSVFDDVSYRL